MASSAWEIRCSLPLAGRDEPQISMAMPLSMSAVPSSRAPVEIERGLGEELVDRGVGEQGGEVVDRLAAAMEGELPVEDRRQLGGQVAHAREPERPGRIFADVEIEDDRVRQRRRQRPATARDRQTRLRAGEAVVGERGGCRVVRQPAQERDVLGDVERLAAAQPDDRRDLAGQPGEEGGGRLVARLGDSPPSRGRRSRCSARPLRTRSR